MKILVVSATSFEISPFYDYLDNDYEKLSFFEFKKGDNSIIPLVTGVGAMQTAFAMARLKNITEVDLAVHVGIAGAFGEDLKLGEVVEVNKDRFADLGVEEKDGNFTDMFELELIPKDDFPFANGWIENDRNKYSPNLPLKTGITVNKVHGNETSINKIKLLYNADVESMETAGFLYACKIMDVKCAALRSVSNRVEPRNRSNWKIELAIDSLNFELQKYINTILM